MLLVRYTAVAVDIPSKKHRSRARPGRPSGPLSAVVSLGRCSCFWRCRIGYSCTQCAATLISRALLCRSDIRVSRSDFSVCPTRPLTKTTVNQACSASLLGTNRRPDHEARPIKDRQVNTKVEQDSPGLPQGKYEEKAKVEAGSFSIRLGHQTRQIRAVPAQGFRLIPVLKLKHLRGLKTR